MDSDISEKDLEKIIPAAIDGDQQALNLLKFCIWFTKLLDNISKRAEARLHVEAAELRDLTFDTLVKKIDSIKNPNNRSWRVCLAGWCKRVCVRHALTILKKRCKFELPFTGEGDGNSADVPTEHRELKRRRNAAESYSSGGRTPEKDSELSELHRMVRQVIFAYPPEDVRIVYHWASGLKLRQISQETGIPFQTVNERLVKMQMAIVNKIALTRRDAEIARSEFFKGHPELKDGLKDLIYGSLIRV